MTKVPDPKDRHPSPRPRPYRPEDLRAVGTRCRTCQREIVLIARGIVHAPWDVQIHEGLLMTVSPHVCRRR